VKIDWIEPDVLAASSIPVKAQDLQSLHQQGIRAIISLTEYPITNFKDITPELLSELNITYFHSPVPDQYPPNKLQAQDILNFLEQMKSQGRAVLIHCHAGIGRTGTILHLYYLGQGFSLAEARKQVKLCRPECTLLSENQWSFLRDFAITSNSNDQ
jgi:atypical dual specificity phosphatase